MFSLDDLDDTFSYFAWAVTQADQTKQIEKFLAAVLATAKERRRRLTKGAVLCRAQRGYHLRPHGDDEFEVPDAFLPERMKPLRDRASAGRVNRQDVPCLYLSDDPDTARAEVRPWVGAHISLAYFRVMKDCILIDCSLDKLTSLDLAFGGTEPTPEERQQAIWGDIAQAFAKPLTRDDTLEEYLATQVLSDCFKSAGYDGVGYKSALGKGKNVALFDLEAADPINGTLYETEAVSYTFGQANNTYYIPKHYPEWARKNGFDPSSPEAANPVSLRISLLPLDTPEGEILAEGTTEDAERGALPPGGDREQ